MKAILLETVLVAGVGLLLAFAANGLSPRGLKLTQNFFPANAGTADASADSARDPKANASDHAKSPDIAQQLRDQGLQPVDGVEAAQLFRDPGHALDQFVFIDARDDQHYAAGHIPGAYSFDHYHAERYFASVLPVCLQAQKVLVYCNGGDCEDSKYAAIILRDAGIPKEKLYVYIGGITEWQTNGLPVEMGARQGASSPR